VTLNGYFYIKPVSGHTNPLCGHMQIWTAFGGGGGNWTRVRKYCHKNFYKLSLFSFFA